MLSLPRRCQLVSMRKIFCIVLFGLFNSMLYAQRNPGVHLCSKAASKVVTTEQPDKCCEKCMQQLYSWEMRQGVTHVNLCSTYPDFIWNCDSLLALDDSLTGYFEVRSISVYDGYYLTDNDKLKKKKFYFLSLRNNAIDDRSSIIWVVDDMSKSEIGNSYFLHLKPYFDKNQNYTIQNGKRLEIVPSGHTLIDIVYKNWLILRVPSGLNLYFQTQMSQTE